jgi:hypothetical protein
MGVIGPKWTLTEVRPHLKLADRSGGQSNANQTIVYAGPEALAYVLSRMLRPGYIPPKSYHFYGMTAALAQLLHCLIELVACPMEPEAEADSRDAEAFRRRVEPRSASSS